MGDYILINGELYHWGVKGMKWGVRRYQNKDGSLTEAGKKRFVKSIAKQQGRIAATNYAREQFDSSRSARTHYNFSDHVSDKRAKARDYDECRKAYHEIHDIAWRKALHSVEKKYGDYEDLARAGDKTTMGKFDALYKQTLDKEFRKYGVYEIEKTLEQKRKIFIEAREELRGVTQKYVEDYLGDYGNKPLKGMGTSANSPVGIGRQFMAKDALEEALMYEIDRIPTKKFDSKNTYPFVDNP